MWGAAKQFLYALIVLFVMLIAGYTILNFVRNSSKAPAFLRNIANKVKTDASGGGLQGA